MGKKMQTDGEGAEEEEDEQDWETEGRGKRERQEKYTFERMLENDLPELKEKGKMLALLFSLSGCCHSAGFVK